MTTLEFEDFDFEKVARVKAGMCAFLVGIGLALVIGYYQYLITFQTYRYQFHNDTAYVPFTIALGAELVLFFLSLAGFVYFGLGRAEKRAEATVSVGFLASVPLAFVALSVAAKLAVT